jgi:mannose-6-phosphate isomerase-like protein (cupin superfamily)
MTTVLLAVILFAADSPSVWTTQEVGGKLAATKADANQITQASLGHFTGYSMTVTQREASGIAELHHTQTDLFVVEKGECTLITGGKIVNPKNTSTTEVRGSSIEGGEKHHLAPGDVVRIPINTPHQIVLEPGMKFVYVALKVDSK